MEQIFKLRENTPDVYVKESRDFQNLCNVFDIMNCGVKYDIDSMPYILDTMKCKDAILPLLQTKLGFYTNKSFTSRELRHILSGFRRIVRDKGSYMGIKEAIEIFLKLLDTHGNYNITVTNYEDVLNGVLDPSPFKRNNLYIVQIDLEIEKQNIDILKEILKYIIPSGYELKFGFYTSENFYDKILYDPEKEESITVAIVDSSNYNKILDPENTEDMKINRQVGTSYVTLYTEETQNENIS